MMKPTAMAWHLANNIPAIAKHPDAGECLRDFKKMVKDIEGKINRPQPDQFAGVCTGEIGYGYENEHARRCAVRLYAEPNEAWVTCPQCKTTHEIKVLFAQTMEECGEYLMTPAEILYAMEELGERLSARTFRHWRAHKKVAARGRLNGELAYWLSDVRNYRNRASQEAVAS
jgi:hypothetical protein